jgi:3-dehydroquinate dehydratase
VAVLSHHDLEGTPVDLDALAREMLGAIRPGQVAKLVTTARSATDVLRVRAVLESAGKGASRERRAAQVVASGNGHPDSGKGRLAAFAMGEAGIPSRILAGAWGSAAVWAAARADAPGAPGQISLERLLGLYRFREITSRDSDSSRWRGCRSRDRSHRRSTTPRSAVSDWTPCTFPWRAPMRRSSSRWRARCRSRASR